MVTSKFKISTILNFIFVSCIALFGSLAFLIKVVKSGNKNETQTTVLGILLFGSLFIASVTLLNIYKYIQIDLIKKELKYHSLINPFGKTINFDDATGFITPYEITFYGKVNTIHFVNKQGFTYFKIDTSHYKNADEIYKAIPLKQIKGYNFGTYLYLKLIFTGKIKVTIGG